MVDAPSANQDSRVKYLVLHFTSEVFAESLRLLTEPAGPGVSAHYLVPEPRDDTYPGQRLRVYRLVPESRRAWHAGVSHWGNAAALNSASIGIEIVNRSRCEDDPAEGGEPPPSSCRFLDFPEEQVQLVIRLARDVLMRNPDIDAANVVGHADIAADRRVDPGPAFPWHRLYENGIGAWYDDETVARYRALFDSAMPGLTLEQRALAAYGYRIAETGTNDVQTRFVVRAFQMHFRPSNWNGCIDAETAAILFALLEKYRPDELQALSGDEAAGMLPVESG